MVFSRMPALGTVSRNPEFVLHSGHRMALMERLASEAKKRVGGRPRKATAEKPVEIVPQVIAKPAEKTRDQAAALFGTNGRYVEQD